MSIRTKEIDDDHDNRHLPFNEIELFIDQKCPSPTTLERMTLQLHRISFSKKRWSNIVRYKTTFFRFDFYGSFIVDKTKVLLDTDRFNCHIEGKDTSHPMGRFVHVYSLPFTFNKLYGFSSCCDLLSHTLFSTVRHLYFTRTSLDRHVSIESLPKRMPYLLSIDHYCRFICDDDDMIVPEVVPNHDFFSYVRFLRFESHCRDDRCICQCLLLHLINRMPQLQSLTTSHYPFLANTKGATTIERLDLRKCRLKTFDLLPQHLPYLKRLFLGCTLIYPRDISQVIGFLFLNIPSLRLIFSPPIYTCGLDTTPYEQYKQDALTLIRNMDSGLRHLKLTSRYEGNTYYLSNL